MLSLIPQHIKQTSKKLITKTLMSNTWPNENKRINYSKLVV